MNTGRAPRFFSLHFRDKDLSYLDWNLSSSYVNPDGMLYFGSFSRIVRKIRVTEKVRENKNRVMVQKWDIWINRSHGDERRLVVSVTRYKWMNEASGEATIQVAESKGAVISKLRVLLQSICRYKPLDMSAFQETETLEEIKETFSTICAENTRKCEIKCYNE